MAINDNKCPNCNGYGHDKAGRPVIVFKTIKQPNGKNKTQHVTKAQGSGCMKCLGLGYISPEEES